MSDILTRLEKAGGQAVLPHSATLVERNALHLHIQALKAQGHAIVFSDVVDAGGEGRTISVQHYLNCVRCRKGVV